MAPADKHNWDPATSPSPGEDAGVSGRGEANRPPQHGNVVKPASTFLQKIWRRLCVWMPTLANPHEKRCMMRYENRDARKGMQWTVLLPQQCWMCSTEEGLESRRFDEQLKVYHQPVMIISVSIAFVVLIILLTLCFMDIWLIALVCIGIVAGGAWLMLKMKSWYEEVRLHIWSCRQHAGLLEKPDMIVEDEALHIFLPTPEIARAARVDLKERRRSGGRGKDHPADSDESANAPATERPSTRPPAAGPPSPFRYSAPREELPPIKLDGDDDDASPGDDLLVEGESPSSNRSSTSSQDNAPPSSTSREEPSPPQERKPRQDDSEAWFDD